MTHAEAAKIRVGDVLRSPSGDLRVVRMVARHRTGRTFVGLAIRRCSWTRRPYTIRQCSDLIGWTRTRRRVQLRSKADRLLARQLADRHLRPQTCCDVEWMP